MPDLDPPVAEAASIATSIEPVPAEIEDEEDVETAMLFLAIFKEHHHLIDKSCRDFWKVVTEKCHDAGIYVGKDSTNMYMDIWPGFVEHSKANFQTDTQTEIDKIVMEIVVSRKPNSFVKKPPLTARQRAVANYHPPKIGIVEPEAQPINGRAKKAPTNKPPPTTSRTPSRPPARPAMASSDQTLPNSGNGRSNGNNVLVADPPPLPAALPPSALGFHDNRTPTETIIALMQGIQQGLAMQHGTGQHGHVSSHVRAPRAPAVTHNAPRPNRNPAPRQAAPTVQVSAPPPAPPRPPPQPISRPAPPAPAPQLPTVQESFTSVASNPPPPVQPVPSNEAPANPINANPKSAPSSSSESHASKIPDNLNFLQYLIAGTTFNVPFGGFPALPSWMTLPPPPANATPFNLTPQQIHFEAMRTGMLMNQANPGYSFGGQTPQKLADLFGYAGAHSWVPNKAQPTPSQFGNENFPFANNAGSIPSDTSSLKTGDFMNSLRSSNASRTSSSLFSTTSFDPFCFAHSSSSNTQTSADSLKTKAKSPQKPATPTFVEPLPRPVVEKESTASKSKPSQRTSDENGNKKPREKSLSATPKQKDKKSSKRKSANTPEGDGGSGSRTPVSKRRRQVSPRAPSPPPKEPAPTTGKVPKKRGPKPKRQREQSSSPPPCSSFAIPVRQSMRVAIRNSLYEEKSDVTTDDSSTSLASKARRTRSVAAPIFASRRAARSRTCAKLAVISTDDDD